MAEEKAELSSEKPEDGGAAHTGTGVSRQAGCCKCVDAETVQRCALCYICEHACIYNMPSVRHACLVLGTG